MNERFLFYVWQFRLFNQENLRTTTGEEIQILRTGELNTNSGPDFTNVLIKIGDTTWAGNLEIHINASDWDLHNHQGNDNYDNIVLHVVLDNDRITLRKTGEAIPTLELKSRLNWAVFENYQSLLGSRSWIPCGGQINKVSELNLTMWLDRLLIERMERKAAEIGEYLSNSQNNLEEAFYFQLAKNFGFKINSLPFEMLAKSLPLSVLAKHRSSLFQLESLLFGQAGLLDELDITDEYFIKLKAEYSFLKAKFKLQQIDGHLWKFMRLRPYNFPTIRIAQFAYLVHQSSSLLAKILDCENWESLQSLFHVNTSEYWETHFTFGNTSAFKKKSLGNDAFLNLVINSVVPMLFLLAKHRDNSSYSDKALGFLENIPAEKNQIITGFTQLGIKSENANRSQALIELKNNYCAKKRCLECGIGKSLLK